MPDDVLPPTPTPRRRRWGRIRGVCGVVLALVVATVTVLILWPTPGALIVRAVFEYGGQKTRKSLAPHRVPGIDVTTASYRDDDSDATIDVYRARNVPADEVQPVLVWTHGGGWVAGTPDEAGAYFTHFAAQGFTVVSVGYGLAPGKKYPLPVHQLNDALAYLEANRRRLGIDTDRIVMAGDSAGAQITGQVAAAVTSPVYAQNLKITPALEPEQLRGVILHCGIYNAERFLDSDNPIIAWAIKSIIRSYTGSGDPKSTVLQQFSSYDHVTADFPTAFIAGGNDDPLTDVQSKPLAQRLQSMGVSVETAFFPKDYRPKLPHEFQFNLDTEAGQKVLKQTIAFAQKRTATVSPKRAPAAQAAR